jgi:hypothetical protein
MPVVNFATNQVMVAQHGTDMEFFTAPHPMGGMDYVEAIWNISALDMTAGVVTLTVTAQYSNDGINWLDSTTLTDNKTSVPSAPVEINGYCRAAFIRFKCVPSARVREFVIRSRLSSVARNVAGQCEEECDDGEKHHGTARPAGAGRPAV